MRTYVLYCAQLQPGFPPLLAPTGEGLGVRARGRVPGWRPGVMAISQIPGKWWAARGRRSVPPLPAPTGEGAGGEGMKRKRTAAELDEVLDTLVQAIPPEHYGEMRAVLREALVRTSHKVSIARPPPPPPGDPPCPPPPGPPPPPT